jgi:catechol 2,3-dioxygenase-like lactoylglutathione lyase family enzyme
MQINGIAHIQLTVNRFSECRDFYLKLFAFFEMAVVFDEPHALYGVGGRTGICVTASDPEHRHDHFIQRRIGLHHLCFRLRAREDVDSLHAFLHSIGARVIHPPEEGPWARGYYSVLFEDPDGIRLEANFVPGKGNLDPSLSLPLPVP